jgi:hypothetical protein
MNVRNEREREVSSERWVKKANAFVACRISHVDLYMIQSHNLNPPYHTSIS